MTPGPAGTETVSGRLMISTCLPHAAELSEHEPGVQMLSGVADREGSDEFVQVVYWY
jgi:hypothetical protein